MQFEIEKNSFALIESYHFAILVKDSTSQTNLLVTTETYLVQFQLTVFKMTMLYKLIAVIRGFDTNFNKIAVVVTEGYANIKVIGRLCNRVGLLLNKAIL